MSQLVDLYKQLLLNPQLFIKHASHLQLRQYQVEPCLAIINSVIKHQGLSFVIMFPRQSGKNELQAQLETYLLTLLSQTTAEMVKISPTWKPQSNNAMRRLDRVLKGNFLVKDLHFKEQGYIYRIGSARIYFFSGQPEANIVGATASALLSIDEAQDIQLDKYDKDIAPMAASTNATRVFWGTAWTARTLLARELRAAREQERKDGIRRTFVMTADDVSREVPAYKKFVQEQVSRLGRTHPLIRTQYFSEEIDAEGGMFPPERQALMQGSHPPQLQPTPGCSYAITLDLAGEDEAANDLEDPVTLENPGRDATALTVYEIDAATLADPIIRAPTYKTVYRQLWTGSKHTRLYAQIKALADLWQPRFIAVDATGVGAGLASFLEKAYPDRVIPYVFNASTKSKLGWGFLTAIDSGRYKEFVCHCEERSNLSLLHDEFFNQLSFCQYEIQEGPDKKMKWSVPDGTRDPATGDLVHDDLVLSAALVAALDEQDWTVTGPSLIVHALDPLLEMDKGF